MRDKINDEIKLVSSAGTGTFYTTTKNLGESRPDA